MWRGVNIFSTVAGLDFSEISKNGVSALDLALEPLLFLLTLP